MYGSRRFTRKSSSGRAIGRTGGSRGYTRTPMVSRFKPRGTVARRLNRREIKYDDDYFNLNSWVKNSNVGSGTQGSFVDCVMGGVVETTLIDAAQLGYPSGTGPLPTIRGKGVMYVPNCLTNINSGTTAMTRIGNMVQPRFITLKGVVCAGATNDLTDPETIEKMEPEAIVPTAVGRFVRTSVKIFIVRDKHMNEKGFVEFEDVFQKPIGVAGTDSANNKFLWNRKIDTLARYQMLKEVEYQLDADDPQKSFTWSIPLKGVAIRYNGAVTVKALGIDSGNVLDMGSRFQAGYTSVSAQSFAMSAESQSMTNGVYILAVSHTSRGPGASDAGNYIGPSIVFSSRISFED